jgi:hypothetical protein
MFQVIAGSNIREAYLFRDCAILLQVSRARSSGAAIPLIACNQSNKRRHVPKSRLQ